MSMAPSSPRLPSPPPPAEIQVGPKSPSMGPAADRRAQQHLEQALDANAKRRIHPGTRSADMAAGPPLVPLQELDSAFQLQEHLAALHYHHTTCNTSPMTREASRTLGTPPPGTDKTLWLYELCRFLIAQCNSLIVGFLFDTPPCSAATCPEMRASEWQFLCAVHDSPKSCCAIDYCCHTLDWAANVVTNPKIFPSRFVVDAHDKTTAQKNLVNVFRRLHRIFAHAWFQHRGVFWSIEGQTGLYVFFKTVCDVYDLLPAENYKLPPEAEGLESLPTLIASGSDAERKLMLQQQQQLTAVVAAKQLAQRGADPNAGEDDGLAPVSRTSTRRHIKSSPSTGIAITTVPEADEDDNVATDVANRLREMHISMSSAAAAALAAGVPDDDVEEELATIPVIVEHRVMEQPPMRPSSVVPISGPGSIASMRELEDALPEVDEPTVFRVSEVPEAPSAEPEVTAEPESKPELKLEPEVDTEPTEPETEAVPLPEVPGAPSPRTAIEVQAQKLEQKQEKKLDKELDEPEQEKEVEHEREAEKEKEVEQETELEEGPSKPSEAEVHTLQSEEVVPSEEQEMTKAKDEEEAQIADETSIDIRLDEATDSASEPLVVEKAASDSGSGILVSSVSGSDASPEGSIIVVDSSMIDVRDDEDEAETEEKKPEVTGDETKTETTAEDGPK
ncbi:Mob1/phocein [Lasiosphaeris hirsuta]|uniref:Mob1/phocein n=1 Tax=Lasiosphaeris hirsuta TaxID=260670 RepID=A0AA40DTL3_9PEZI|nr:Mob1/phocein [Lasiosphaeris hirsuta]